MMTVLDRRGFFLESIAVAGCLTGAKAFGQSTPFNSGLRGAKDEISLAEWTFSQEIQSGSLKTLDFPKIAREEFDIGAVELVNTLFEVPTYGYLKDLKKNAQEHGVKIPVLMVDDEGDPVSPDESERSQFITNHRKWIDIASLLGCRVLRTNCRGGENVRPEDALKWATDSYGKLLEFAIPAGICIVIENHGGLSDNPDWMIRLINNVDNLYFGSYIDWRWREPEVFDNLAYLKKLLPYAQGLSYKKQPSDEHFERMVNECRSAGYRGFYAIEQKGFEEIRFAKMMFEKFLFGK